MSLASHKQNANPSNETNFTPITKSKKLTQQKRGSQGVKTLKALNTVSRIKCSHCRKYGSLRVQSGVTRKLSNSTPKCLIKGTGNTCSH